MHDLTIATLATLCVTAAVLLVVSLGKNLARKKSIRQFFNTTTGIVVGTSLCFLGFLTACAGAAATQTRLDLIALGFLVYTFFVSVGIFSEEKASAAKYSRKHN